MIKLRYTSKCS